MSKKGNKQVNKNLTKLIRIDSGYHKILKIRATNDGVSIKELLEGILSEVLVVEGLKSV